MAKLNALNDEAVAALNAAVSPVGLASNQEAELERKLKAKGDAERAVHDAFATINRKKYPQMYKNEVSSSNSTPYSDGQFVYWACGGGMKGPGAHVFACFDLDGRRVWSFHEPLGAQEHGEHNSPNLVDGKLVHMANMKLLAFDARTGKELWRNSPDDWQNGGTTPVTLKIGGESAILDCRYLHRASDGTVICPSNISAWGVLTPIIENGVMFMPSQWQGFDNPLTFVAVRAPASAAAGVKATMVWKPASADVAMPIRGLDFYIASPLYVNGVVYSVNCGGGLTAVDVNAQKGLYHLWLDGYTRYNRYVYGIAASPTLAGKHIYITDDAGYTYVIQPGPRYQQVAGNVLENLFLAGQGGNPCKQESFYTSPVFDGAAMYLRGEEYLYCIGGEKR